MTRNIEVTDEWLYKYMPVVDEALIRSIEKNVDYEYRFSDEFERRMKKLMRRERYLSLRKRAARIVKRAAIFLLVLLAAVGVLTVSVEALRIRFFETIKEMFSDYYTLTYTTDDENMEFDVKTPQYVPDGYQETFNEGNGNLHTIMYENSEGEMYVLDQFLALETTTGIYDSEYMYEENVYLDDILIEIYWYESGRSSSYCEFKNCVFQITADSLTKEEIQKIYLGWIKGK